MGERRSELVGICAEAALQIYEECSSILSDRADVQNCDLAPCGHALVSLLAQQASQLIKSPDEGPGPRTESNTSNQSASQAVLRLLLKRLDDILSIAYSKFYAFLYKDLPICWRQLYTDASILKFYALLLDERPANGPSNQVGDAFENDGITALVRTLDLALILAGAAGRKRGRRWIDGAFVMLDRLQCGGYTSSASPGDHAFGAFDRPTKRLKRDDEAGVSFSTYEPFTPPVKHPIRRAANMSIGDFQSYVDSPSDSPVGPQPLVLGDILGDWPARTTNPWNQPAYLLSRTLGGRRLVPVEIGRSYVDEGWGQKLVTFREFLQDYIDPSLPDAGSGGGSGSRPPDRAIAYLAQHQLFTQLPALRNDILVPDLCYTSPPPHPTEPAKDQPELDEPLLNAWLGPPGTITPLHNDPYHNLLAQVVGRKYVRLYSPTETARMQARGKEDGVEMGNTSMMDVGRLEGWDLAALGPDGDAAERERRAFRDVPFVDCILEPGDTLYIPIGWWHYVRGLSVSFSVSFWWN